METAAHKFAINLIATLKSGKTRTNGQLVVEPNDFVCDILVDVIQPLHGQFWLLKITPKNGGKSREIIALCKEENPRLVQNWDVVRVLCFGQEFYLFAEKR